MLVAEQLNTLDPYYPNSRIVWSYVFNNRSAEALVFSEKRLNLFKNYSSLDAHGFLLLHLERYQEAVTYFNQAIALEGIRYPRMLGWMGAAYAKAGDKDNALKIIDELKVRLSKGEKASIAFFIATVHAALDEKKDALDWIDVAYKSHDMEIPWLMTEPQFISLHNEPRFRQVIREVGLW
jgi:tetratricopeptide (TPR) repeat protein